GRRAEAPPRWAARPPAGLAPGLAGSLATLSCTPWAAYDGGDHVLFVGRVEEAEYREGGRPLVFFEGEFRGLQAPHRTGIVASAHVRRPWAVEPSDRR
ncbi:flavin reductase family protein, partial [Streptomyces roseoverticillatus]|uniref:flavin reductase family protein n=1 Tax=Streptomyces roseoverticillatus TaxID=66429 RepID=UPI0033CD4754